VQMAMTVRHNDIEQSESDDHAMEYAKWLIKATSLGNTCACLVKCLQMLLNRVRLPSDAPPSRQYEEDQLGSR